MKYLRLWLVLVLFSSIVSSCSNSKPKQSPLQESKITLKGQSLEELIAESGIGENYIGKLVRYENFPYAPTTGEVRVVKVCVNRVMSAKEVRGFLDRKGLVGADIGQLIAYYSINTGVTLFNLVALGSIWRSGESASYCPYVSTVPIFNNLDITGCSDVASFYATACFLAVPKSQ